MPRSAAATSSSCCGAAARERDRLRRDRRRRPGARAPAGRARADARSHGRRATSAGARWVVADAATGEGVAAALERADVVYYLVHSLGARDFEEQDRAAAETVAREAADAGVRQIVYLGGLGADDPDASPHLRSRRETGERLAVRGRAGDDAARGDDRRQGQRRVRDDPRPRQAAAGDDHPELGLDADAADRARRRRPLPGRRLRQRGRRTARATTTAGPEVMTYRQMIERIAALLGRKPAHRRGARC